MPENQPLFRETERRWPRRYRRGTLLLVPGLFLSSGCLYNGKEATDDTVKVMAAKPYDQLPEQLRECSGNPADADPSATANKSTPARPTPNSTTPTDVQTAAYMAERYKTRTASRRFSN